MSKPNEPIKPPPATPPTASQTPKPATGEKAAAASEALGGKR